MNTDQRLKEYLDYICQDVDKEKLKDYFVAIHSHTKHAFRNTKIPEKYLTEFVRKYVNQL